jgi:hypothetical protein
MASPETGKTIPNLFEKEDARPAEGKSFKNLTRFLEEGAVAPLDRRNYYPKVWGNQTDRWERNLRMTYGYAFGDETLQDIGNNNNRITRETVRQIIKRTVKNLLIDSDEETRSRYRFESFDFAKPLTLASRQRLSEKRGGRSIKIAQMIEEGATLAELKQHLTTNQIAYTRNTLKSWGYDLPRKLEPVEPVLPRFEGLKNQDATDQEIQVLLNKITTTSQVAVLKEAGLAVGLLDVARKAGLYLKANQIYLVRESLARENPPIPQAKIPNKNAKGQITGCYHIIAAIDEPEAINILRRDIGLDALRINPVSLAAGTKEATAPNTTELIRSDKYDRVGNLIEEIRGIRLGSVRKDRVKIERIIEDSPVPVYRYSNSCFYRKDQENELRSHILSRLRRLGLI